MSYPDLGCFAECLTCEICNGNWGDDKEIDLDLPDDYDGGWDDGGPFDFDDWAPEPDEGGLFDDFDVPGVPLPGGGEGTPTWNDGPGIDLTWPFD